MYQLYRLFDSAWLVWEKPIKFASRRKAIAYIRLRYGFHSGTFKVRKVE